MVPVGPSKKVQKDPVQIKVTAIHPWSQAWGLCTVHCARTPMLPAWAQPKILPYCGLTTCKVKA